MRYWQSRRIWRLNSATRLISQERYSLIVLLMSSFCICGEETMGVVSRPDRLQVMLNSAELKMIDNWRFLKRMPSRASAVRELLKRGLSAEGFNFAEVGKHSSTFGVTGAARK